MNAEQRLARIAQIIEHVDNRAMAGDGDVLPTLKVMVQSEISEIYELASSQPQAADALDGDDKLSAFDLRSL